MSNPPPTAIMVTRNGRQLGPFSPREAWDGVASGHLLHSDLACGNGSDTWQPLGTLVALPAAGSGNDLGRHMGMRMLFPVGRSGWAVAAGYLGLLSFVVIPAPLALIAGIIAIVEVRKHRADNSPRHGMGRAVFGLTMGLFGTGVLVLLVALHFWWF